MGISPAPPSIRQKWGSWPESHFFARQSNRDSVWGERVCVLAAFHFVLFEVQSQALSIIAICISRDTPGIPNTGGSGAPGEVLIVGKKKISGVGISEKTEGPSPPAWRGICTYGGSPAEDEREEKNALGKGTLRAGGPDNETCRGRRNLEGARPDPSEAGEGGIWRASIRRGTSVRPPPLLFKQIAPRQTQRGGRSRERCL